MIHNKTAIFLLLLLCPLGLAAAGKPTVIPDQWIVELEHQPVLEFRGAAHLTEDVFAPDVAALEATAPQGERFDPKAPHVQAYVEFLDRERTDLLSLAGNLLGREMNLQGIYRHVLNGFSASMTQQEAEQLSEMPGVRLVRQDLAWNLELDRGPEVIGATTVWSSLGGLSTRGEGVVVGIIDTGINWDHIYFSDDTSDTGGYTFLNPLGQQLGECSKATVPCNDKLIGIWNFTDEDSDGLDLDGHGTHVASTAVGNPWTFSLSDTDGSFATSGVAPRANVVSYKVCYSDDFDDEDLAGKCAGSAVSLALEQAIVDGVDVLNYSIGGDANNPWDSSRQFLNVRNAGILFVTSAGNSGPDAGSISSPANAPWTLSVGSTTHGRRIGHRADVAGEDNLFMQPGTGPDFQSDINAPVIAADDVGSSLEGCSSFAQGAFADAIAFMIRGDCTFQTKVENAQAAGAVAVLIFNHQPGGGAITMAGLEGTVIPAGMLDNEQGLKAQAAIQSAANPQATLYKSRQALINPEWQDRVSGFSSRGPGANAPDVMKPNVTAPGQSILGGYVPDDNSIAILSGTSMAGPHVAGAAALLKSMHPDWTPDIMQSALETTAEIAPVQVGTQAATMLDRGAGRIRVDRAARIGLYLPISGADFDAANPAIGGQPEHLNLPGIMSSGCADVCTFVRTVRALTAGSWSVSTEGELDISVSPQSFSLEAGQQEKLTIQVGPGSVGLGQFGDGAVLLTPSSGSVEAQRLPVGILTVFADLPEEFHIATQANRGTEVMGVPSAGEMIEPLFRTSELLLPDRNTLALRQDSTRDDPYEGDIGTTTILVDVPEDTLMLYAEVVESTANDIDLFVGRDDNGDGEAELSEEDCNSTSPDELETCAIELPEPGTWWVRVQNWEASGTGATDRVEVDIAVLTEADDDSLVALGPARHEGGALDVILHYDQPAIKRNERWMGAVGFSSLPEEFADVGIVPIFVQRFSTKSVEPTVLFDGDSTQVVVAGDSEDRLTYFDVPPGAGSVSVSIQGETGVSAELVRMDFDSAVPASPGTPNATGAVMASGTGSSGGFEMTSSMEPGRWYVVLKNSATQEARVTVTVELAEADPQLSQRGLWSPRDRLIFQGIEWQKAGPGFVTWYSYDADGLPVFYQAVADVPTDSSVWRAPVYRITNATGQRQNAERVGEFSLTMLADDSMIFAWQMEGFHGSDIMRPDAARTCPEVGGTERSYSGHWYSPDNLVGGTTMIVNDAVQAHIRYYFDNEGIGRWLLANDPDQDPLNEVLELVDFRGFCPSCNIETVTNEVVGAYTRTFNGENSGNEILDFVSSQPLNHEINIDVPVVKLSESMSCR